MKISNVFQAWPSPPQAALAAPSPESVGAIAPKVLGIIRTKALKGFQVIWALVFLLEPHQIVLSWGASPNSSSLPVGFCCHLVSNLHACFSGCSPKQGYPVLKNGVGVTTGWAGSCKLPYRASLKEGKKSLHHPFL